MKKLTAIFFFCISIGFAQTDSYFIMQNSRPKGMVYKMTNESSFKDYFLAQPLVIKNKNYFARIREYSWGEIDTAYFRKGQEYFYSCDLKGDETIEIPRKPMVGQKWVASDTSWTFEIKSVSAKLETPTKNYENLVEVVAKKTVPKEESRKYDEYHNFYCKGIGYVGSIVNGKLFNYLE